MLASDARWSVRLGRHAKRFVLEALLGAGSSGSVHRAYDRQLGLDVALKIPHRFDAEGLVALKHEFRVLAGLSHPNLLTLHELFVGEGSWFSTMDLVDGTDALRFLEGRGLARGEDRLALVGIVDGLLALHAGGVLHRDLKPSNAWIDRTGQAVLLDFGLASLASEPTTAIAGTVPYLAPELLRGGAPSAASDAYALGALLHEALTGTPAFAGPSQEVIARKLGGETPSAIGRARGAPDALVAIAAALLSPSPEARPALRDVRRALGGETAPTETGSPEATSFVGRDALLETFDSLFDASEVRVVRLLGAPGIGKTALLARLRERLEREQGAVVIAGRCSEHETMPFAVLDAAMDALSTLLRREREEPIARASHRDLRTIAEAFPTVALAIPTDLERDTALSTAEPRERWRAVARALRSLLDRLASGRRVALLLDDVQWADEDGASLLVEVLRTEATHGLLVVLAQRDEELPEPASALGKIPGAIELVVPPLDVDAALAIASQFVGEANAERIARAAGGIPFLLEALARPDASLERRADEGIEDLATRAIRSRVSALPTSTRVLLEASAVAGHALALETARLAATAANDDAGSIDLGDVRRLEALRLLRVRSPRRGAIELVPYHDRVREIVVGTLSHDHRRRTHGALARALDARGDGDVLRLCLHHREAGDVERAARLAEVGAAEAQALLAFARAIELYRFALAHRPRDERARDLRVSLGEALVSAGRSADAAEAFLHALEDTREPDARLELRRRAAEQLLRIGHFRRGVDLLDEVLRETGVEVRRSPARALWSIVRKRGPMMRLAVQEREARDPSTLDPAELRRIDACVSGAMGLSVVDSLRSADLMSEGLTRALALGDGRRLAVCTLWQAAFAANEGGPGESRTRALLARGTELTSRHGGAYERGCVQAASALTEFHLGNFAKALDHTLVGEKIFVEETRGARKESATMQIFSLASQAMLGEIASLSRRVATLAEDAIASGDRYAMTNVRQGLPMLRWLACDEPGAAHEDLDRAMHGFDASGYVVQHFFDLFGRVMVLLYEGRVEEARRRYEQDRVRLASSLLARTQWTRVHAGLLDVWTALALARERRGLAREASLLGARMRIARLEREDRPWAREIAAAMRSELTRARGGSVETLHAERLLDVGLGLYAALVEIREGTARGAEWSRSNAIARPEKLTRIVLAPR